MSSRYARRAPEEAVLETVALAVVDDLMMWSRIEAAARRAGRKAARSLDAAAVEGALATGAVALVLVDLDFKGVDAVASAPRWKAVSPPPVLVAFGSHVDGPALDAARRAGFDLVLPRSRFAREIEELLRR